jgi:hypothetical protein
MDDWVSLLKYISSLLLKKYAQLGNSRKKFWDKLPDPSVIYF